MRISSWSMRLIWRTAPTAFEVRLPERLFRSLVTAMVAIGFSACTYIQHNPVPEILINAAGACFKQTAG